MGRTFMVASSNYSSIGPAVSCDSYVTAEVFDKAHDKAHQFHQALLPFSTTKFVY
jgi:hypothetical protein